MASEKHIYHFNPNPVKTENQTIMSKTKHFELTKESKVFFGITLFRIRCTIEIKSQHIKAGDLGGWVEKEENLSGNAWVYGDARVSGNAFGKSPLQIQGSIHFVTECKIGWLSIGCIQKRVEDWQNEYQDIGKANGYTEVQIKEYGLYINLYTELLKLKSK